jgi:hypothetical protein
MKHHYLHSTCQKFRIILSMAVILMVLSFIPACAQTDSNEEKLREMDTSVFGDKAFLNKAIVIDEMLQPFREKQKAKDGQYIYKTGTSWFSELFNLAEGGDLKDQKKPDKIAAILNRSVSEIKASNVIPIGITNSDAVLLTVEQVNENIQSKRDG